MTMRATQHYRRLRTADASPARSFARPWAGRAMWVLLAAALLSLISPSAAAAAGDDGSQISVFLVTMGPGPAVYERFGHNAILVEDRLAGTSTAYNYGLFDFQEKNFILHFIQGRMVYRMEAWPGNQTIDAYLAAGRSVWVQELNLTTARRAELRSFLEWNARPENCQYVYDYYRDNCSTRVRDALDRATGGQIKRQLLLMPTGTTYRFHTRRCMAYSVAMYTALEFVLAGAADRELSAWEESFMPLELRQRLGCVRVKDEAGQDVPLVKNDTRLDRNGQAAPPARPPNWLAGYLAAGVVVGGALVLLGWCARRGGAWRLGFAVLSILWAIVVGFAATFLATLWAVSTHLAAYHNENLLHFSPLALAMIVLLPALAYGKSWARRPAWWVAIALAGCSWAGLVLKLLPAFWQVNEEMIALALPANCGLLGAVYLLRTWGTPPTSGSQVKGGLPAVARAKIRQGGKQG